MEISKRFKRLLYAILHLKAKKVELKKLDAELAKLEEQKTEADAKAAEEAQKAELQEAIQKLMADGVSAAEILEKLK